MNIATLLAGLIPSILQFVEALYGPKNGQAKKDAAVDIARQAVAVAAVAGRVNWTEATDALNIADSVQKIFDQNPPTPATKPVESGTIKAMSEALPTVE